MSWATRRCANFFAPRTILRVSHRVPQLKTVRPNRGFSQPSIEKPFIEDLRYLPILRPILFSIGVSGGALGIAAYWTNRDTETWIDLIMRARTWGSMYGPPSTDDLRTARHKQFFSNVKQNFEKFKEYFGESPNYVSKLAIYSYARAAQALVDTNEGRRTCGRIIALNVAIWLAWQIPRLRPIMNRHFMHYPLSGLSHTLLTSVFSHQNFFHLLFNAFALSGFGASAAHYFALQQSRNPTRLQESTPQYHFISFFISAGLFSSLLAHVVRARFYFPQLLAKSVNPAAATAATTTTGASVVSKAAKAIAVPQIAPSLGASGAIWACVSLSALAFPDARLSLVLPTSFSIPIQTGTAALVSLDVLGIILGWRYFDHWAHLGGALFGALYYKFGPRIWDTARLHTDPPLYDSWEKS